MLFNSLIFCSYFSILLIIYRVLPHHRQNLFLLLSSYFFYGYWDWRFNFLLLTITVVNFIIGKKLPSIENQRNKKSLLILSVAFNLCILGFFKYFNFFIDSAGALLTTIGLQPNLPVLRIILPVGISFYTFQTMSYTIDIYRRKLAPTRNFIDFALFVAFFPQLVAGPIERAANLLPQISKPRELTRAKMLTGFNLVLLGFFKKVAIADTLAPIVDGIFTNPGDMTNGLLWTGVYAFSLQIYGDFSGYTDIARGVARILGFELMHNFDAPYLSKTITEFWRRWHISLSSWLRDYLYIPLGGNRQGNVRTYLNLMITMLLGGLWHGAAWTFVFWGLLHGIYLAVHRLYLSRLKKRAFFRHLPTSIGNLFKIIFTFHIVALTWIFFRTQDLMSALIYLKGLIYIQSFSGISTPVIFAGGLILLLDLVQSRSGSHTWLADCHKLWPMRFGAAQLMLMGVLIAAIAHAQTIIPFIYFQF